MLTGAACARLAFSGLIVWLVGGTIVNAQTATPRPPKCTAAEHRQFDFWIGDWDVFRRGESQTTPVARVRIEPMVDGCAIREVYRRNDGYHGESFSMYDASRMTWHQSWVTNDGELLIIEGGVHDGRMILTGSTIGADRRSTLVRGVWSKEPNGVHEVAETSSDSGGTWKPLFDLNFRRHPGKPSPVENRR